MVLFPERVLAFFASGRQAPASPFPQLSPPEHEVLEMIAQGLDNGQIARRLVLRYKTVRNRVSDILAKLHARNLAEMVALLETPGSAASPKHGTLGT